MPESIGVGGTDDMAEDVGVGRDGSLVGGAIGRVKESRLTWRFMLDTLDLARACPRLKGMLSSFGAGGGGIATVKLMLPLRLCEEEFLCLGLDPCVRSRTGTNLGSTEAAIATAGVEVAVAGIVELGAVSEFELEVVGLTKSEGRRSATE